MIIKQSFYVCSNICCHEPIPLDIALFRYILELVIFGIIDLISDSGENHFWIGYKNK